LKFPVRKASNRTDVGTSTTQLYAFENILAEGRIADILERTLLPANAIQPQGRVIQNFSLNESFPAMSIKLKAAGASTEAVPAFYLPSEKFVYPTLSIGLEIPEISISIQSSATIYPGDPFSSVTGEIRVKSTMTGPVAVYAPGLVALQTADFGSTASPEDRAAAFLALLPHSSAPLKISGSVYTRSFKFQTPKNRETPALFMVKHPVTVAIGKWSACLNAETYSPVPVALTEAHCQIP
jgi:hypothetical protein